MSITYIVSAAIATTVSMPMDVFSTMAVSKDRQSYRDIITTAYRKLGVRGFFAGYKWRLAATTIEFVVFNNVKTLYTWMVSDAKLTQE
ncbi:Hypothetical protein HVR_LOCUS887 [uncultured virus]|nr:Hypothetical protein HVR_LOCUS887 [uncultured virus]